MDRYNASYIYSYFLGGGIRGMVVVSMGLSRFDNGRMEGRKDGRKENVYTRCTIYLSFRI